MSNGHGSALSQVIRISQRDDSTIQIHVQTNNFTPGRAVEVSGYLTQGSGAYVTFNVTKHVSLDPTETVLHVELPATDLTVGEDVTVVTRVAEVWPTVLGQDFSAEYLGKGLKAVWTAEDYAGKGSGGSGSPSGNGDGGPTPDPQA